MDEGVWEPVRVGEAVRETRLTIETDGVELRLTEYEKLVEIVCDVLAECDADVDAVLDSDAEDDALDVSDCDDVQETDEELEALPLDVDESVEVIETVAEGDVVLLEVAVML